MIINDESGLNPLSTFFTTSDSSSSVSYEEIDSTQATELLKLLEKTNTEELQSLGDTIFSALSNPQDY